LTSLAERTSGYFRVLRIPIFLGLAAVGLLAAYYSIYVRDRADYLTGRNLRLVADLGRQIEASLADHATVLASFSTYYGADLFANDFACVAELAGPYVPMFEYVSLAGGASAGAASSPPCKAIDTFKRSDSPPASSAAAPVLFLERDSGVAWTRRAGAAGAVPGHRFVVPIGDVLDPLFAGNSRDSVFDAIVIATSSGRVMYQAPGSELRLATLNRLMHQQADRTRKELDFANLPPTPQVLDVELSGGRYTMYLQSCCLELAEGDGANQRPGWIVAGLIDAGTFRADSMAVSFSMMALFAAVILLTIFSWPFLKLALIGEGQRLRLIDALLVGVCALLGTALVTAFVVDAASYALFKGHIDRQLETLSETVRANLARELDLAVQQLQELQALPNDSTQPDRSSALLAQLKQPAYPLMESFTLIDARGMQARKWAAAGFTTPRISTRHRQYFQHWMGPHPERPPYFLESIRSGTTGHKQAVLSAKAAQPGAAVAALTVPLISLTDALLPPGFGFAVIDEDGAVLFHSDTSHSLDEQFFLETDQHRRLRAASAARRAELVSVRYFGRDHRAYVAPIERPLGSRWSLVTFSDKEPVRTVNIEWLLIALLLTVIYVAIYLALCAVILLWRPDYRAPWVWPDPSREPHYQQLVVSYAAFAVVFAWAIHTFRDRALLAVALLLPFIVWAATYVTLTRRHVSSRARRVVTVGIGLVLAALLLASLRDEAARGVAAAAGVLACFALLAIGARLPVRFPYRAAATLLLVVTAVLPTLAFFKVAHAIQVESFIKYAQLDLARSLQRRADAAKHELERLGAGGALVAASMTTLRRQLSVYDAFFFDTVVSTPPAGVQGCGPGAAGAAESDGENRRTELPKALEELLPYYSESSVGMRELLHDRSSDGAWLWQRTNGSITLQARAESGGDIVCVRSTVPQVFALSGGLAADSPAGVLRLLLIGGVLVLVVGWVARFIARRVLLIDVVAPLWARCGLGIPTSPGTHLYIRWLASDRRSSEASADEKCLIDVGTLTAAGADEWFTRQRDRLDQAPAGGKIVIDHLVGLADPALNRRTLALIHDALDVQHRTVVLVSPLTPQALARRMADAAGSDAEATWRAWQEMLSRFTMLDGARLVPAEPPAAPEAVTVAAATGQPAFADPLVRPGLGAPTTPVTAVAPMVRRTIIRVDYGADHADPAVRSVWSEVEIALADASVSVPFDRDQLFEEVGDRLDHYYRGLWSTCSHAEKRVLMHLALDGLINEKDRRTARVLLARGLVRKNPNVQIVDATFRQFILARAASSEAGTLARERDSAWDHIRMPFLAAVLGICAFFFLTQRELFTTTMAVITALAGGIPAAVRVIGLFERRPQQPSP
jgi:hypothetical protein